MNVNISDEDQAILLLTSLPKAFDLLKDTQKYSSGKSILTLDEVVAAIYSKELELGSVKKSIKVQAEGLFVKDKNEAKGKGEQKGKGKGKKGKSKKKPGCWIYGEEGHFRASCPNQNKPQFKQSQVAKGESLGGKGNIAEAAGYYVSEALSSTDIRLEDEWILDTGCSYHMTYKREWFEEFDEEAGGCVRMGNKTVSRVKGIGTIRVKNDDGLSVVLTNVRYIPDMDRNLLSLGTFEKAGYKFESENGILSIKAGSQVRLTGRRYDTLYLLNWKPVASESLDVVRRMDDTVLWHRSLCHMSRKNMEILVKRGLLDGKKVSVLDTCEDCIYGKAKRIGFNSAHHGTTKKLEYVHSDLWGAPLVPFSLGKCQYFMSVIDDYTRKVWVYFLKTKDEAFEKFVDWVSLVENQSDNRVKTLRTDNGL